jgi:hypothetical protein
MTANPAYNKAQAITPSDTDNIPQPAGRSYTEAVYVGSAGDVALVTQGGDVVTFVGVPAGTILPINVVRVNDTNTSADDLVGLWQV